MNQLISLVKNNLKSSSSNKTLKVFVIALFFILVIIALIKFDLSDIKNFIIQNKELAVLISFVVNFVLSVTFIPTVPFAIFISVLIGPLPTLILTTSGNTLAAFVHYQVGKSIGDVVDFEEKRAKLPFKLGKLPINSPIFLLAGRAVPGGPKGLSFVCGAYRVPFFLYTWTTFVTNVIGAAFVAYGGNELIKLF